MSRVLTALFSCVTVGLVSGCGLVEFGAETRTVAVDSITVAAGQPSPNPVPVRFWGWVGPSGCSSLASIERSTWPDSIELRFVAEQRRALCTQMPVELDHVELIAPGTDKDFTVIVRQPDRSRLRKLVPRRD